MEKIFNTDQIIKNADINVRPKVYLTLMKTL